MVLFIIYILTLLIVFFLNMLLFYLDNKFTMGEFREIVSDYWVLFLIVVLIPLVNVIVTFIVFAIFIIIIVIGFFDDIDGEEIIKKLFFIKDED